MFVKPSQLWSNLIKLGQTRFKLVLFGTGHYIACFQCCMFIFSFFPSQKCSAIITKSFEKMVDSKAFSWKKVSKSTKKTYFDDFQV